MLEVIKKEVIDLNDDIINLRRYFHMYPEVGKNEYMTAAKIEEELKSYGLNPIRVGQTGVYAEINGSSCGKVLALRADIDALPIKEETSLAFKSKNDGVMHACGHDVHTASLLSAAKILVRHKDELKGKIKLFFQQAEEIGYGAKVFIENGYLNNVDCVYGLHIASNLKCGKIACVKGANNASVDWFKIKIKGKSSHISTPEGGIDALHAISKIVVAIKALANDDKLLIGIGKLDAGLTYNIIAEDAYLEGTIRAFDQKVREITKKEIQDIAESIAEEFNAKVEVLFKDYTSPLINSDEPTQLAQDIAESLFGKENVIASRKPSLSGDDFAELIIQSQGCYSYVGTYNDDVKETKLPHHNSKLIIDENVLSVSTMMYAAFALKYLND